MEMFTIWLCYKWIVFSDHQISSLNFELMLHNVEKQINICFYLSNNFQMFLSIASNI